MFSDTEQTAKQYLVMSDFDQTLSFNDSGLALSELLGIPGFLDKVAGLSNIHLVQQGGELAYLLLHDPEFRQVRKHHLVEVGKRIRLKDNIRMLSQILEGLGGNRFAFYVISAAPQEVIQSALEGIVPAENIYGTRSIMTNRLARSNRSFACGPATERLRWWKNFARRCRSATIL